MASHGRKKTGEICSNFCFVHLEIFELTTDRDEVCLLSKIYNIIYHKTDIEQRKIDGILYGVCSVADLTDIKFGLPYEKHTQKRILQKLKQKNLVDLQMIDNKRFLGLPPNVTGKIRYTKPRKGGTNLSSGGDGSAPLPHIGINNIKKTSKKDSATLHPSASHTSEDSLLEEFPKLENKKTKSTSGKKKPTIFENWSIRLRKILRSRRPTVQVSRSPVKIWEKEFKLLYDDLESDDQRIDEFLDWYEKNISNFDKPLIASAKQFRARFNWLENIRSKMQQETQIDEMVW